MLLYFTYFLLTLIILLSYGCNLFKVSDSFEISIPLSFFFWTLTRLRLLYLPIDLRDTLYKEIFFKKKIMDHSRGGDSRIIEGFQIYKESYYSWQTQLHYAIWSGGVQKFFWRRLGATLVSVEIELCNCKNCRTCETVEVLATLGEWCLS